MGREIDNGESEFGVLLPRASTSHHRSRESSQSNIDANANDANVERTEPTVTAGQPGNTQHDAISDLRFAGAFSQGQGWYCLSNLQ